MTLTGPGGSGKARLAIEAARRERERFAGPVRFLSLVDLSDPCRLPELIRDALDLPLPAPGRSSASSENPSGPVRPWASGQTQKLLP